MLLFSERGNSKIKRKTPHRRRENSQNKPKHIKKWGIEHTVGHIEDCDLTIASTLFHKKKNVIILTSFRSSILKGGVKI